MVYKNVMRMTALLSMLLLLPGCWASEKKEAKTKKERKQKRADDSRPAKKHDGGVRDIQSVDEFDAALKEGKPVIADFHAEAWCGPCKEMHPVFHDLAEKHPDAIFVALDADNGSIDPIFRRYNIRSYPTFIFIDAEGKEASRKSGGQAKSSFEALIVDHIRKAGRP